VGPPVIGKVEVVSGNFYEQMQVKPQLGRLIEPADDATLGSGAVAVISSSFWRRAFGGARDVLGALGASLLFCCWGGMHSVFVTFLFLLNLQPYFLSDLYR
jgi:hypothetical protein